MNNQLILILGVTASGKSALAFDLAAETGAEIISVDSMKIYRRMDIGTAKPAAEIQQKIKYHMIDVVEPSESFSVGRYLDLANDAIKCIQSLKKPVIAVGGTSLYIKALLYGLFDGPGTDEHLRIRLLKRKEVEGLGELYDQLKIVDPMAAERIHPNDSKRIIRALEVHELTGKPISSFQQQWGNTENLSRNWKIIGLRRDKEYESKRINLRVKKIIAAGLVDEVKMLLSEQKPLSKQASAAIGYAEMIEHLKGGTNLDETIELIKRNTRRFAKSQRTWFKTFRQVNWLDIGPDEQRESILHRTKQLLGIN